MKVIKEQIKTGNFKQFYLIYGSEEYLKKLYRDKLKSAILPDGSDMNYSYYAGSGIDPKRISEDAQTLPFFSDRRLIVIENSSFFKSQNELSSLLKGIPDTTIVMFIESDVDKRSKLFKLIRDEGTVSEMNGLDEKNLKLFTVSLLEQEGKRITEANVSYLLDKTGSDMNIICNEVQKIIGYTTGRDVITAQDVDAVVVTQTAGKIFHMIDAIGSKQPSKALELYYDLLSVREKPMSILYLLIRHFNILLQSKDLQALGFQAPSISEKVGVPPFAVKKYLGQARNFSSKRLREALEFGAEIEEQVKTGRMLEKIAVELFIVNFSK